MKLGIKEKAAYGLGAVGKDMVYMLSAGYILYYYQDILGVGAAVMGMILLTARVFDAFNDPVMGVLVAKTGTRWGRFRPWLLVGTVLNAVLLCAMFSAPSSYDGRGLAAYAAVTYILWGITYTMMDIPFWSMIPAFTDSGREREKLTALARSSAGAGAALVTVITVKSVYILGRGDEREGFRKFALITAALFAALILVVCAVIKERPSADMRAPSVKEMFSALLNNDQAMTVTAVTVLINCSFYITSNLVIYFFKYDFGGADWYDSYTVFNIFGGGVQILSMMFLFPLMRKYLSTEKVFLAGFFMAAGGYAALLAVMFFGHSDMALLLVPAFFIFAAFGLLTVLTTVFLANTVDYGEYKNGRRDESVIFSMQTFVVKLASGAAAMAASVCLSAASLGEETASERSAAILRLAMTVIPAVGIIAAGAVFKRKFTLTDKRAEEISSELKKRANSADVINSDK